MAFLSFGKRPKHRSFDYKPRFYDPEKEALEARLAKYKDDPDKPKGDINSVKTRIRGGFGKQIYSTYETDAYRSAVKKSNKFVILIALLLLAAVLYFLLEYFPKMVEAFD